MCTDLLKRLAVLSISLVFITASVSSADRLITSDKRYINGELSLIANDYVEFRTDQLSGTTEWVKISKRKILAILGNNGHIIYPRDKFDENALNFGKIRVKNNKELEVYRNRKRQNISNQLRNEKAEKQRFKIAALIGGLAGLMVMTIIR